MDAGKQHKAIPRAPPPFVEREIEAKVNEAIGKGQYAEKKTSDKRKVKEQAREAD